jgi:hypothetical protein
MRTYTEETKFQREKAKTMDSKCHQKAIERNQQTFTLVEQDRSSPRTICFWILENIETAPREKLVDALLDAITMREAPLRKNAD